MSAVSETNEPVPLPVKRRENITRSSDTVDLGKIVEDVRNPPDARDRHIIDGVIANGLTMLFGPSGCGKTGIAINLALAVASGSSWAGIPVKQGGVLYLPAEDYTGVCDRLAAASEAAGIDHNGAPLWVKRFSEEALSLYEDAKNLKQETGFDLRLVVVDTLSAAFVDEDQDRAAGATKIMRRLQVIQERHKCAVLVIHHTGKGGGNRPTGSGVFWNRSDMVLRADQCAGFTKLTVDKRRDGRDGASFQYEITGHPFQTSKGTIDVQVIQNVRPMTGDDLKGEHSKADSYRQRDVDVARLKLLDIAVDGKASFKTWKARTIEGWAEKPSEGAKKTAFTKAQKTLLEEGRIAIEGDMVTVTVTGNDGNCTSVTQPTDPVTVTVTPTPSVRGVGNEMGNPLAGNGFDE
ncbi:AAA family ATPase [Aurantimonas endophytica]|uniref:AAA+ ATPase domain-containing protein n=1 Tax=Aurantimonas endophytica TaxID=1522175 RepID=A0A7W6HDI3_9HYPH|nr:AAA family ATPase [Aurantimonas endophytica]MBB4003234.1 hypothetical protein [Aurantimonas endophytica]MCO6404096.1 AAA family ATPase [Aurantimonas endophytica]